MNRRTFSNIALLFIPLGFIGGLSEGSLSTAIISALIWSVIYFLLKPKTSQPSGKSSLELLGKASVKDYTPHQKPNNKSKLQPNREVQAIDSAIGTYNKILEKAISFSHTMEWSDATYDSSQRIPDKVEINRAKSPPSEDVNAQMKWLADGVYQLIENQKSTYASLLPFLLSLEEKFKANLSFDQKKYVMFCMRIGYGLAGIENVSKENRVGYYHPSILNILTNPLLVSEEIKRLYKLQLDVKGTLIDSELISIAMEIGYFVFKYSVETPDSVLEKVEFS